MTCPKCKAKVGIVQEKIRTVKGLASGKICYMCGHWIQESQDVGVSGYTSLAYANAQDYYVAV